MAVLVTGGSGLVGLNIIEQLLDRGDPVVAFSLTPSPESAIALFESLLGDLAVVDGDVRDGEIVDRLFRDHAIDRVIHGAAITADDARARRCMRDIVEVNILGTIEVLEAARRHSVSRFIYISSASVYGQSRYADTAVAETAPALPEAVYGTTKFAAERMALSYRSLWELDVVAVRPHAVFGRWEYDTGLRDLLSPPLQATRLAVAGEQAVLPRADTRDWLYGADAARGILALLDLARPRYDVYNLASGDRWSMVDWCEKLAAAFPGFSCRLATTPGEANIDLYGDRDRAPLTTDRLADDAGFRAEFGLDAAFSDYIEWIRAHRIWR